MRFGFLLFCIAAPFSVAHPHKALTDEQISLAKVVFQQFKADPTNPQALMSNPGLLESLKAIFGGMFGDAELEEIFLDIFACDDCEEHEEHDHEEEENDVPEESVTGDDHKGGSVDRGEESGEKGSPTALLLGLPSDIPSLMPSDIPSSMPSDLPSSMPSDVPSSTPIEWINSTDPSIKKAPTDFVACPNSDGISSDLKNAPKLTLMYGYRLELEEDAEMSEVIEAVEEIVTAQLLGSVCGTDQALAVSAGPKDIPGGELIWIARAESHALWFLFFSLVRFKRRQ